VSEDVNSRGGRIQTEKSPIVFKYHPPTNVSEDVNSKGRKIHTGEKGGRYVLIGSSKQYIKTQKNFLAPL
jgi:hypothetical protein